MIIKQTAYRFVQPEELVAGFTCQKYLKSTNEWVPVTITEKLSSLEEELYIELLEDKRLRVAYIEEIEVPDEKPTITWFERYKPTLNKIGEYIYSSLFSVAHGVLWWFCTLWLNHLEETYPKNIDTNVMGLGTQQIQLSLTVLAAHLSSVFIASLVDWTQSGMQSYIYQNPYILKNRYDLRSDLTLAATDTAAKIRMEWHQRRFYTFYFISIALQVLYYWGNLIVTRM